MPFLESEFLNVSAGSTPLSYMPWSGLSFAGALTGDLRPASAGLAEPSRSKTRGSRSTVPWSGSASPRGFPGLAP
jgi:hypothetical protein